jgi:hypothetical protein
MATMSRSLLIEEELVLYVVCFVPGTLLLGVYLLVSWLRKRKAYLGTLLGLPIVPASALHLLILALAVYSSSPRYFARQEVVKDLDTLVTTLEDVHPNIYDRISKRAFAGEVSRLKERLPEQVEETELYREIAELCARIQDGHTGRGFNIFTRRGNILFKKIFPYRMKVQDDRLFITGNYSYKDDIPIGSEIVKINGQSPVDFVHAVSRMVSYENVPFRNMLVCNPLLIGVWNNWGDYTLEYRPPLESGTAVIRSVGGLYARMVFLNESMKGSGVGPHYVFKTLSENVGYLGFYSFTDLNSFRAFLHSVFGELKAKRIRNLIIDIRENGGGDSSLGDELMQYIAKKPFRMFDSVMVKVSAELLSKGSFAWVDSPATKVGSTIGATVPTTALREDSLRFEGRTYLLTSGQTFSSATCLASAFQCYGVGTIVGTETGGLTVCYGDVYRFELPNSRFDIGVSWKKFYNACGVDNRRGVAPEYAVVNSLEDDRNHNDGALAFTLDLIRAGGSPR